MGCNNGVATTGTLTDAEIIETVNKINETNEPDEDPSSSELSISAKQAKSAVNALRAFIERCSDIEDEDNVLSALFTVENIIDKECDNSFKKKLQIFLNVSF